MNTRCHFFTNRSILGALTWVAFLPLVCQGQDPQSSVPTPASSTQPPAVTEPAETVGSIHDAAFAQAKADRAAKTMDRVQAAVTTQNVATTAPDGYASRIHSG